jgi:type I restriction enzyme S subunit
VNIEDWKTLPLGEALTFQRGFDITKNDQRDGPYPVISSSGAKSTHAEFKVRGPGVIIGRKGSLGTVFYSSSDFWPHDTTLWVKNFHGNSPRFAYYFLKTMGFERLDAGASNPTLNRNHIHTIPVLWPSLPIQQRIAGILSGYDELIENSQRRIGLLERMARSLYREWFVKFRFPGHDQLRRVPSALGDIPEGWAVESIGDICESVNYGYTTSADDKDMGPKFLRITDIVPDVISWPDVPYCAVAPADLEKYLLKEGDIVIARTGATTGYAKRMNKRHPTAVFASYLVRARAKKNISNRMLGILMESEHYKRYIKTNIGGAAQPQANAVVLTSMQIAVPPREISQQFDQLAEPIMDRAELLALTSENLRRTRDLLLPWLLSGQAESSNSNGKRMGVGRLTVANIAGS